MKGKVRSWVQGGLLTLVDAVLREKVEVMCNQERLQRAQILLDLFEEDCGHVPASFQEIGVWALESHGHLDSKIEYRLAKLLRQTPEQGVQESEPVASRFYALLVLRRGFRRWIWRKSSPLNIA
jgi:hypothetical protein